MSLAFSGAAGKNRRTPVAAITRSLRKFFTRTGRLVIGFCEALAEARLQKAMIEAELYRNRYLHTSKNDDDLPLGGCMTTADRPYTRQKIGTLSVSEGLSRDRVKLRSPYRSSRRHRARIVVLTFGLFSAAFAVITILRGLVSLPVFVHQRAKVCAMTRTEWDFDTTIDDDARDDLQPKSPDDLADQFGIRSALLVLCIASFIAAIWFVSSASFEKCSSVENVTDRNACYEGLRKELLKPPAKGADIPRG